MSVVLRYLKALKDNRSLIWELAAADLKNRYRNSVLGFIWSVLEPLLLLVVLDLVFSSLLAPNVPNFAVYLLLGLIVWDFITKSTTIAITSISSKTSLLSNVYFQRAIPALSATITGFMMFTLEFVIFSFIMVGSGVLPTLTILLFPYLLFLAFVIVLGLSLPLSVINVLYKDIQFIWRVLLTAGFFIHPIVYTIDLLPEDFREKVMFLPTVRLLNMMHGTVIFGKIPSLSDVVYVTVFAFVILGIGYAIYRLFERRVAEEI